MTEWTSWYNNCVVVVRSSVLPTDGLQPTSTESIPWGPQPHIAYPDVQSFIRSEFKRCFAAMLGRSFFVDDAERKLCQVGPVAVLPVGMMKGGAKGCGKGVV